MLQDEPSLSQIDDFNNKESEEKRSTIKKVILLCLVVGAILAGLKVIYNDPGDYVGTPENPGINTAR